MDNQDLALAVLLLAAGLGFYLVLGTRP